MMGNNGFIEFFEELPGDWSHRYGSCVSITDGSFPFFGVYVTIASEAAWGKYLAFVTIVAITAIADLNSWGLCFNICVLYVVLTRPLNVSLARFTKSSSEKGIVVFPSLQFFSYVLVAGGRHWISVEEVYWFFVYQTGTLPIVFSAAECNAKISPSQHTSTSFFVSASFSVTAPSFSTTAVSHISHIFMPDVIYSWKKLRCLYLKGAPRKPLS